MKNFSGEKKGGGAYFRKHVYFEFHIQQGTYASISGHPERSTPKNLGAFIKAAQTRNTC